MKVKLFDEEDEGDLEDDINDFLSDNIEVIDIKYEVAISIYNEEQVYCFSAMIVYTSKQKFIVNQKLILYTQYNREWLYDKNFF